MYKSILAIFLISCFNGHSQTSNQNISNIEVLDSSLIGKKIKKAIESLDLDSNYTVIQEPPGIVRGIWIKEIEGYQIQLLTKRTVARQLSNKKTRKLNYAKILKLKIIGVSWQSVDKCNSVGDCIPQFAFDKYGPCE